MDRVDPFVLEKGPPTDANSTKADFDAAFSDVGQIKPGSGEGPSGSRFNSEFPPIEEFDDPDEPESADEEEGIQAAVTKSESPVAQPPGAYPEADFRPKPAAPYVDTDEIQEIDHANKPVLSSINQRQPPPRFTPAVQNKSMPPPFVEEPKPASESRNAPTFAEQTQAAGEFARSKSNDDFDAAFEGLEDTKAENNDFDAIFSSQQHDFDASFDNPPVSTSEFGYVNGNKRDLNAIAGNAPTRTDTKASDDFAAVFSVFDSPNNASSLSGHSFNEHTLEPSAPSLPSRDGFSNNLSKQDSPDLTKLVNMGFSRKDATNALEKHNYNLEEVKETLILNDSLMLILPSPPTIYWTNHRVLRLFVVSVSLN